MIFTYNATKTAVNWLEDISFTHEFLKGFCEREKWNKWSMEKFCAIHPQLWEMNLSLEDYREMAEYFNEKYYV